MVKASYLTFEEMEKINVYLKDTVVVQWIMSAKGSIYYTSLHTHKVHLEIKAEAETS